MNDNKDIQICIPDDVLFILNKLKEHGKESYVVGGCVRDSILKREIHDWDVTTSATPLEVMQIFQVPEVSEILPTGLIHGTVTLMINHVGYEVTTYRIDGEYEDSRRPSRVEFTSELAQDLSRRDFTINAMAYNPWDGLIDLYDGMGDLKNEKIRCVGRAEDRFNEDALRILRAIRFASQLEFVTTPDVDWEIHQLKEKLRNISIERICWEFKKIATSSDFCVQLLLFHDVFEEFIPELKPMVDFQQNNPWHIYDVLTHTVKAIEYCESSDLIVRLSVLLHDIGKPTGYTIDEDGVGHFPGYGKESAIMAKNILRRMKFDSMTVNSVTELVLHHDEKIDATHKSVKKWLNRIGEEQFRRLLEVRKSDVKAQNPQFEAERLQKVERITEILEEILVQEQCFTLKDLAVNGRDLIKEGIPSGKSIGYALNLLLNNVIDGECDNTKEALLSRLRENRGIIDEFGQGN